MLHPLARSGRPCRALLSLAFGLTAGLLAGCAGVGRPDTPLSDGLTYRRLGRFAAAWEFDGYLDRLRREGRVQHRRHSGATPSGGDAEMSVESQAPASPAPAQESAAPVAKDSAGAKAEADASITNNQEAGVDEGDIVKAAGDYLIILRRGRLFTVRQREAGQAVLTPAGRCNAYPEGGSQGTWYDEMLVHKNRVIVIGYSYQVGGTEVGLFRLDGDGSIHHQATHFLRSNDYYSSRNYASRLVDGKLIVYMPYYLNVDYTSNNPALPAAASWDSGAKKASPWSEILSKMEIYRPVQRTLHPTLHTVIQCDVERRNFACTARAVLGPYSRTFYVSRDAVYIWVSQSYADEGGYGYGSDSDGERARRNRDTAFVYRLPILKGDVAVMRSRGQPVDQFAFKESDKRLNVLLSSSGYGDGMWGPEAANGQRLALLRVRLSAFSDEPTPAPDGAYTPLPGPKEAGTFQNRFVGNWLLWGSGAGWWGGAAQNGGRLYLTNLRDPAEVRQIGLQHGVDRLEPMGENAVAIGAGKEGLVFSAIDLRREPRLASTHLRREATQGETRSHGFFFQPEGNGGGLLGLPVRLTGRPGYHLVEGSAEVVFLRVSNELNFSSLGALTARAERAVQDACVVSCVDWYGNARPIFFRGRIFALLGYELVEGKLDGGRLFEQRRIDYLGAPFQSNVVVAPTY